MILDRIIQGDVIDRLKDIPSESIQTVVTSPPYWALRDYGIPGQIGLEPTPEAFVEKMVGVFWEVRRVLRKDGTLWLNLGDTYNSGPSGSRDPERWPKQERNDHSPSRAATSNLKPKDMCGIPWRVAFALQADGWYLRSDIIWEKPNPMPESVTDRPTKSHEYMFLMTKSESYYYDAEAIKERSLCGEITVPAGWKTGEGSHASLVGRHKRPSVKKGGFNGKTSAADAPDGREAFRAVTDMRNKRTVWKISTQAFPDAHFATFPEKLIEPCILAGSRRGDIVLDPFMGAGTTALVAARFDRRFLGVELNPAYIKIAEKRIAAEVAQAKLL